MLGHVILSMQVHITDKVTVNYRGIPDTKERVHNAWPYLHVEYVTCKYVSLDKQGLPGGVTMRLG